MQAIHWMIILLAIGLGHSQSTEAKDLNIVTTLPDLAWAGQKIIGTQGSVTPLLSGEQDPHYIDAVPKFILQVAKADVVCSIGLDLEIGWLPKVLAKSGRAQVQPGGKGHCVFGTKIKPLEKPKGPVDRSMGDVHPAGNPHYYLSPSHLADGAQALVDALIALRPKQAKYFLANYQSLKTELTTLQADQKARLQAAVGAESLPFQVIQYHSNFSYWLAAYGLTNFGAIEQTPGVHPSASRIATIALAAKEKKVQLALATEWQPQTVMERFHELSQIPILPLPAGVQADNPELDTYPELQKALISKVIGKLKPTTANKASDDS
jgi:zinc/manganese transport system substrate-binding protein